MTAWRRFTVSMECPAGMWRVEAVREVAWMSVRQRLEAEAYSGSCRVLDSAMVPKAMAEVRRTAFFRDAVRQPDDLRTSGPVWVPCEEEDADMVVLTLSAWCLSDKSIMREWPCVR